jgi:hypothetical protein
MSHTNPVSGTLYLARLLEVSASGRVVVECVTVHPDAGMPPAVHTEEDGGGADERRFVGRLLADAHRHREVDDDAVEHLVRASRRLHTIDVEFDDGFWERHKDRWWVTEPVVPGARLRDWLSGPSDGAPFQVAAFEAGVDPELVRGLEVGTFDSTAYRWRTG